MARSTPRFPAERALEQPPGTPVSDVATLTDIHLPAWSHPEFDSAADRARARLEGLIEDPRATTATVARACTTLLRLDELQRARVEANRVTRVAELGAFAELTRRLDGMAPRELIDEGAFELCSSMGFHRTLFSTVTPSTWCPRSLFIDPSLDEGTDELRSFLTDAAWRLDAAPLESEVVRRRRPQLVHEAQDSDRTFKPLMQVTQSRSYVVAPVWVRRRVVGLLHADRWGEPVSSEDVGRVEAYAECFGAAAEVSLLRSRLRSLALDHGEALIAASARVAAFDGEIDSVAKAFGITGSTSPAAPARGDDLPSPTAGEESADPFAALSPRESEVLTEMSAGRTNAEIATRLGLTEGTVKSYVKGVLRKLDVSTRAAAAASLRRHRSLGTRRLAG
jgi:DNA-binding CsgD family transcriptional regulator